MQELLWAMFSHSSTYIDDENKWAGKSVKERAMDHPTLSKGGAFQAWNCFPTMEHLKSV